MAVPSFCSLLGLLLLLLSLSEALVIYHPEGVPRLVCKDKREWLALSDMAQQYRDSSKNVLSLRLTSGTPNEIEPDEARQDLLTGKFDLGSDFLTPKELEMIKKSIVNAFRSQRRKRH